MNLFEFYRDVALRYQEEHLGIKMTEDRHQYLKSKLTEVQISYFQPAAPIYNDPDNLIAYTLHFAPKHAVIWRSIGKDLGLVNEHEKNKISLNSIGLGPGPDIIGLICSLDPSRIDCISVAGFEKEDSWRDLFEIVREELKLRTGKSLNAYSTNTVADLLPDGKVIGSLVLSELTKQNQSVSLLSEIQKCLKPHTACFLDFNYTVNNQYFESPLRKAGFKCSVRQMPGGKRLSEAIEREMNECDPLYCPYPIQSNQNFWMFEIELQ